MIHKYIFFSKTNLLYVIEMTYRTVGVKLVVMASYGARFVVLTPPFLSDWLKRLYVGKGTKISPRHVILYNALFSLSPRNPRIISYSLRVHVCSPQHNVTVKLHSEHDDSLLGLLVACILWIKDTMLTCPPPLDRQIFSGSNEGKMRRQLRALSLL